MAGSARLLASAKPKTSRWGPPTDPPPAAAGLRGVREAAAVNGASLGTDALDSACAASCMTTGWARSCGGSGAGEGVAACAATGRPTRRTAASSAETRWRDQCMDVEPNVGAFSFLVTRLSRRHGHELPVIAIEPEPSNYAFLSEQPFARDLRCLRMAIGAQSGAGRLLRGANSATHQVVLDNGAATGDESVPIVTLESICTKRTLLKMDIEGGEWSVLAAGLPAQVVALFLECHAGGPSTDPRALINEGRWTPLSADLYGSSTWFWSR